MANLTGPEHYLAAEALLDGSSHLSPQGPREDALKMAQIHATLALASATALVARQAGKHKTYASPFSDGDFGTRI